MSYIEIKTIAGKQYKYLMKSVRDGDKMKKVFVKYLGPAHPVYKIGKKREKTNASIFVRKLNDKEINELKKSIHSSNAFTRDRAKIILLSSERIYSEDISKKINCEARKVRKAIVAFNKDGLNCLERRKAKGAKPKFSEIDKKIIILHFSKSPREFGIPISAWTLPKFRKHLIESNVVTSISIEKLRQIIILAGAKLKRSKRWQYSPDKKFGEKKESH